MKKLLIFMSFVALLPAFSGNAERKVAKISHSIDDELFVQEFEYDNNGRLSVWKEMWNGWDIYEHKFSYLDDRNIRITGFIEEKECVIDITLNSDGLVESAVLYEQGIIDSGIYPSYKDGLMTEAVWQDFCHDNRETSDFVIENGNPVSMTKGLDSYQITYTDLPNKCGMAYLPFIVIDWEFRSLLLTGLTGYGSRNLPYSCRFDPGYPAGVIDYELDEEGYVLSMNITNTRHDTDGQFRFEYCEVAGIEDVPSDRGQVSVHAENGSIVVDGPYDTVAVYNLLGVRCGESGLTSGVYVVDVDGSRRKISVR